MPADPVATARACYEAYVAKDRAAVEALIAPGFHFTSPLDNRIDRLRAKQAKRSPDEVT